jgi:hypothetical protein
MPQWELHDGQQQVGPLEEDHVIRMIEAGLPDSALVRAVGETDWRGPRSHAPFAAALERRGAAAPTRTPKVSRAPIIGGAVVAILAIGVAVIATSRQPPEAANVAAAPIPAPRPRAVVPPPAEPDCGGGKVDWRCPIGRNDTALATFKATSSETSTIFHVSARLSDYFNYEYRGTQKTHYAVEVRDTGSFAGTQLHAYIARSDPTAPALFDLLKDGEPHTVTIELAYNKRSQSTDVAKVVRFLCGGWQCEP